MNDRHDNYSDRLAAVHEAGHALVAHALGHEVIRVFIGDDPTGELEDEDANGGVALFLAGDWRHALLAAAAGRAAEHVCYPGEAEPGGDYELCLSIVRDAGFPDNQAAEIVNRATDQVATILSTKRSVLEAIADYLHRHRHIEGASLAEIISATAG